MAKDFNGEYRSQLYRCPDMQHITKENFEELPGRSIAIGDEIICFITYLQNSNFKGQSRKQKDLTTQ